MSKKQISTVMLPGNVRRLMKDIHEIERNDLKSHGIFYIHDENQLLKGYALIIGQSNTPYHAGYYFFEFNFPENYPFVPPIVNFCTNRNGIRFHPNLYENGHVCLSILNTWDGDKWSACNTISSVLLSMSTLFVNDPLLFEPGVLITHCEMPIYNQIIEYANIQIAICDVVEVIIKEDNNTIHFPFFFHLFSDVVIDKFMSIYCEMKESCEKKKLLYENTVFEAVMTKKYRINCSINYDLLSKRLQYIYEKCIVLCQKKEREQEQKHEKEIIDGK